MDLPPTDTNLQISSHHNPLHFIKFILVIIIFLILGIIIGASQDNKTSIPQTIMVTGEASQEVDADTVVIKGRVNTYGNTSEEAKQNGLKKIEDIKIALNNMGVPPAQLIIEDTYESGSFGGGGGGGGYGYYYPTPSPICLGACPTPAPVVFIPTATPRPSIASVTTFKLNLKNNQVAQKDAVIQVLKLNQVDYPTSNYTLEDKSTYDYDLKTKALQDAKYQAENIAKVNKMQLGKVISIKEPNYISLYSSVMEKKESTTNKIPVKYIYEVTYDITPSGPFFNF